MLRVAGGRPTVAIGGVELLEDADVVLIHDADTAAAIHRGDLSAQQAVEAGRLKLRGDTQKLIASAAALGAGARGGGVGGDVILPRTCLTRSCAARAGQPRRPSSRDCVALLEELVLGGVHASAGEVVDGQTLDDLVAAARSSCTGSCR